MNFEKGWRVLQDIYDMGELCELYKGEFDPCQIGVGYPGGVAIQLDDWRELPMLAHLQLLLSEDPYYGAEMRTYNMAPWWYEYRFELPLDRCTSPGVLRFEGVDYYCKVWLNGTYLGEHEGYTTPFEFEVGGLLEEHNVLMAKVWSPLDFEKLGDMKDARCLTVVRHMLKGTYEHGDSLIHRDRNPVGIWREVSLRLYDEVRIVGRPKIDSQIGSDGDASVYVQLKLHNAGKTAVARLRARVMDDATGIVQDKKECEVALLEGENLMTFEFCVAQAKRWNTWDRGGAQLYTLMLSIDGKDERLSQRFGIRTVELNRTQRQTCYALNGHRLYIRGASYYPETYLSAMYEGRYRRDMEALKRAGCNMVRVHVHQDKQALYDICDELGIAVMQDTDFNWVHPSSEEWAQKALRIVEDQVKELYNHPSILTWVCLNEPVSVGQPDMGAFDPQNPFVYDHPGPEIYKLINHLNPNCTLIRGSFCEQDSLSGDSHNYHGSIYGPDENYLAVDGTTEKFNTEFGFDAPPTKEALWRERRVYRRLNHSPERADEIAYYQYRYLKHLIEHYRLSKYTPTSGHIQFMLIDCSPGTFYGVLDWWGNEKLGMRALYESNQPLGVFYQYCEGEQGLYIVNDGLVALNGCKLVYVITDSAGEIMMQGERDMDVAPDSIQLVMPLQLQTVAERVYMVQLSLLDRAENVIARNRYEDPFHHPAQPAGHPGNFSHTWALRLY